MSEFSLPKFARQENRWGPCDTAEASEDMPLAPFSKSERLGRAADWTAELSRDGATRTEARGGRNGGFGWRSREHQVYGAGVSSMFAYQHMEDESSFSVVDRNSASRARLVGRGGSFRSRGRGGAGAMGARGGRGGAAGAAGAGGAGGRFAARDARDFGGRRGNYGSGYGSNRGGRRGGWKDWDKPQRLRDASVTVRHDWQMLEEIEFVRLQKLNLEIGEGEDVATYGFIYPYDKAYDKLSVRLERPLQAIDQVHYNITTTDDPVIQDLAMSDQAQIFATDNILSLLMCSARSVHPWDIVVTREGNKLYLDKRDGIISPLNNVSVNENAPDPPMEPIDGAKETINSPRSLALEATYVNQNFGLQVVKQAEEGRMDFEHPNPFYNPEEETEPCSARGYRYRKFDISTSAEQPISLIVRAEVDSYVKTASGETQFLSVKALNEFDSKAQGAGNAVDWRSKLDGQRGSVVATEMKNNSCKLARWVSQAVLAGCDSIKLGFVSRVNPRDSSKHAVLGVFGYNPRDFAAQMNLSISNGWGIVRTIADMCLAQPDGKYVIVKDPNKPILRFYSCPMDTFDDEDQTQPDQDAQE